MKRFVDLYHRLLTWLMVGTIAALPPRFGEARSTGPLGPLAYLAALEAYRPHARAGDGVCWLPDGEAVYRAAIAAWLKMQKPMAVCVSAWWPGGRRTANARRAGSPWSIPSRTPPRTAR